MAFRDAAARFGLRVTKIRDAGARFALALPVPLAPTLTALADQVVVRVEQSQTFIWTFNEPSRAGATQSAYALKRRRLVGNVTEWWRASDSTWQVAEIWNVTGTASAAIGANAWIGYAGYRYAWAVAAKNDQGGIGPYAGERTVTFSLRADPVITGPATVTTATFTITWTCTDQSAYQVRLLKGAEVINTSGKVADQLMRSYAVGPVANADALTLEVTTWNADDLASAVVTVARTAAYTAPSVPTIVGSTPAGIPRNRLVITNPAGGDTVTSNEVWRSATGDAGTFTRIATGVAPSGTYDDYSAPIGVASYYFVRALGTSNTLRDSAIL